MVSDSDWETMRRAAEILDRFDIPNEAKVVRDRTPDWMVDYAETAEGADSG